MLHKFAFQHGRVSYANRYLDSSNYRDAMERGTIAHQAFGTDPCRSIFRRVCAFSSQTRVDNANVSVSMLAHRFVALTETPLPVVFDPVTLRSSELAPLGAGTGQLTTAHPHLDFHRGLALNYCTELARKSRYHVVSTDETGATRIIGSIRIDRPAYMHSFAITARFVILAEFPIVVYPLMLKIGSRPFIENFRWQPQRGTRFWVMNKDDGHLVATYQADACFAFHHVNAFEREGDIVLDVSAYHDAAIIEAFYLDKLRDGTVMPIPELRRYCLARGRETADYEVLSQDNLEFPRINYQAVNTRPYQYVYGAGTRLEGNFIDELVKVDLSNRTSQLWYEDDCYPGEPVFVAAPGATHEDDGVILAVVLDGVSGRSFLLVLDATSFTELGRATLPHHIPFGFHRQYVTGAERELHLHR